jgi:LacI family transcriptional regulator
MHAGSHPEKTGRVTLREIAATSGVAVSTASRVLSRARRGEPPTSEVAVRVLAVAEEMGYERDLYAASLRTQRTHMIGVLVPQLTDVVLSTIYEGIDQAAAQSGYQTVVANTLDSPDEQRRRAETLLHRRVDGLIFGDARTDNPFLDDLAARDVPFALVSRRHAPYTSVTCDDFEGGRLVGNHLADLGHRRIAVIAGQPYASTGIDRTAGCLEALAERGIEVPPARVVHSTFDAEGGRVATTRVMRARKPPTAIFVVNDVTAIGAMGALRDLGYEVGHDIAVVGFNDISIAAELPVPLTRMGAETVRVLLHRLTGEPGASASESSEISLSPRLVVRESSDPSTQSSTLARPRLAATAPRSTRRGQRTPRRVR